MKNEYQFIDKKSDLEQFCGDSDKADCVVFDTEFVSEDRYQPELCLVQIGIGDRFAIVDCLGDDLIGVFWDFLTSGDHVSVAHASRAEFQFCFQATGKRPSKLFDVQIGAGLMGLEFPAAYSTLVNKLMRKTVNKGETRSNWRKRPLSQDQLDYALQDVVFLKQLYQRIYLKLQKLERLGWMDEEMDKFQADLEDVDDSERWRRMAGISSLNSRCLAIVRELWNWRDTTARSRDVPFRRVLRDDLLIELSRRGTSDIAKIKLLRGLNYRALQRDLPAISEAIERANNLKDNSLPERRIATDKVPNIGLLGQFLYAALSTVCRDAKLAPSLVGTAQSVKKLAAWRLGLAKFDDEPSLATGWRADIVGTMVDDLLAGRLSLAVDNPNADQPLKLLRVPKTENRD